MEQRFSSKPKTVGVLIDNVDEWYQCSLWKGIKRAAWKRNINLLFFTGMQLKSLRRDEMEQNVIYQLVNTKKLDGIIISSGAISSQVSTQEYEDFVERFSEVPIVSISVVLKEAFNVTFDNKASMRLMVEHLVKHHGFSKIAFIKGPNFNSEAILRFQAYEEVMKENGIELDDNIIFEGDFMQPSATLAIDTLINERKLKPEAIICANDEMAIGAYMRLRQLGFKVGKDIALTGFDDIETVRAFLPPFTTVRQPMYEMGAKAVEIMNDILDGREVSKNSYLQGELVIRESCGCFSILRRNFSEGAIKNPISNGLSDDEDWELEELIKNNRRELVDLVMKELSSPPSEEENYRKIIERLIMLLIRDLRRRNLEGRFIENLNYVITDTIIIKKHHSSWHDALYRMRYYLLKNCRNHEVMAFIEELFYRASILTGNILCRRELINQFNIKSMYKDTRKIVQGFNSALDINELNSALHDAINWYGIQECYLCLYDKPIKNEHNKRFSFPPKIKMVFGYFMGNIIENEYFDASEMLPDKYIYQKEWNDLIFLPLLSGNEHYGYIVCGTQNVEENVFESLREHVSNTLKSQHLFNELKDAEQHLSLVVTELKKYNSELNYLSVNDELTGLLNRRGFYLQGKKYYDTALDKGELFTIFFCDMDSLKKINDTHGHHEGDQAIKAVSQILINSFRKNDIIARIGGDEFVVLSANMFIQDQIETVLRRIRDGFERYNRLSNKPYTLSMSIGYASYDPASGYNFEELIKVADNRLYEQKQNKKTC